jgi:DNA-binding NarL/FixJ family response regulator
MQRRRVFVVEDHATTRSRLVTAIANDTRLCVIGESDTIADALLWFATHRDIDAALVDLDLPDGNGVDLIAAIARSHPEVGVLVITVFGDEKHVVPAIEAGATGYLLKDRDEAHVTDSICEVLDGGSPISPSIARLLLNRFRGARRGNETPLERRRVVLTGREDEVLRMVVKGYSYQEIATYMAISVHTVTSHIQHIYRKLAVRSRGEAVFEAIQLGMVDIGH